MIKIVEGKEAEEKFLRVLDPFVADLIGGDFLGPGPPCVGTGDS